MSLQSSTAWIVPTLIAVALTRYLPADEQVGAEKKRGESSASPIVGEPQAESEASQDGARERASTRQVGPHQAEQGAEESDTPHEQDDARANFLRKFENAKQLVDDGRYAEAIKPLQQLLAIARYPRVNLELGRCFVALREYDLAISNLSMAMIAPGAAAEEGLIAEVLLERGRLYLELDRVREALDDFSQGVAQDPLNPHMLYGRGLALLEMAKYSTAPQPEKTLINSAILSFDRALSIDEGHVLAYYERGMARAMLGQEAEASENLARAVQADDQDELAQRLAELTVSLTRENEELKQSVAALKAEAEEAAKAGEDRAGQLSEIADTLRQIRDLLADPRERRGLNAYYGSRRASEESKTFGSGPSR